jgi:hypothetical protein
MSIYRGVIHIKDGKPFLDANSVVVGLDASEALFKPFEGHFIAVNGEQDGALIRNATPAATPETAAEEQDASTNLEPAIAAIKSSLTTLHRSELGVLGVRPGFSEQKGDEAPVPVIIVITEPGKQVSGLPAQINNIKVEIRPASVLEIVEGIPPLSAWESMEAAAEPPPIKYKVPPANRVKLEEKEVSNITCHVGPDSGWSTLKPFLEGTKKSLTVAMYEFYAEHILETVKSLGEETDASLDMILQVDSKDKDCEETLAESWEDRLKLVPAVIHGPNRVFNSAYHTKVAVRDSKAMWLSSGNWSPNSQPLIKAGTENAMYRNGNREWHVIIEDKEISKMYEEFIRYDMEMAEAAASMEAAPLLPDLLVPESFFAAEAAVLQEKPFVAKKFAENGDTVKVKPLMSPDNYAQGILDLIQNAKKSVYLQFSYINQPSVAIFDRIISAISQKMKEGLDVKVIAGTSQKSLSSDMLIGKRKWKRSMFRLQKSKLHNKGVIVDGKIAVVGSNNWSNDGVQYNRDTSLVFYSRPIAQYYTEVFLFDWDNLTKPVGSQPEMAPMIAPETGPTPQGMVRIPWKAWFDE